VNGLRSPQLRGLAVISLVMVGTTATGQAAASARTISVPCSGPAALITAVKQANAAGGGTISLAPKCTYTFTTPDNYWYGPNALPAIASAVTIEGHGARLVHDPGSPSFRFFFVGASPATGYVTPGPGNLTIEDLTVIGGIAHGGNSGVGGGGAGMGGAIFNQGYVTLARDTFAANLAAGGNSGILGLGNGGGGIGSDAPSGVDDEMGGGFGPGAFGGGGGGQGGVDHSNALGGGGAGFRVHPLENGGPAGAETAGTGGGVANGMGGGEEQGGDGSGGGTIVFTSFDGGIPGGFGGAFGQGGRGLGAGGGVGGGGGKYGDAGFGGGGGYDDAGGFGGGGGAGAGGGFGGGDSTNLTYSAGGAGMGGAVFNMQGALSIGDTTFVADAATGGNCNCGSSAGNGAGVGGAVANLNGVVTVNDSTFADNTAPQGGGAVVNFGYDGAQARTATVTIRNSILWGNANGTPDVANNAPAKVSGGLANKASATIDISDHNLIGHTLVITPTIIGTAVLNGDPQLGGLAYDGGPGMPTMAPKPGSPVLGAGDAATCATTDERGYVRTADGCDLGAFQSNGKAPPPPGGGGSGPHRATLTLEAARTAKNGTITLIGRANSSGRLTAKATAIVTTTRHHKRSTRVFAYGQTSTSLRAAGAVTLRIAAGRPAKRVLHRRGVIHVRVVVTLFPVGGPSVTAVARVTLHPRR
jgi:hypothetical protein